MRRKYIEGCKKWESKPSLALLKCWGDSIFFDAEGNLGEFPSKVRNCQQNSELKTAHLKGSIS